MLQSWIEKLVTIAENEPKVYEAGKKAEYDRFWDIYQKNGQRTGYYFAFAGTGWNDESFKPKYDIVMAASAINAFQYCSVTDLTEALKKLGITLDISQATNIQGMFAYASTKSLPLLDIRSATTTSLLFSDCTKLERIEKLIVKETMPFSSTTFSNCKKLKDVVFEGAIGQSLNMQSCISLSADSIVSVVGCLSDAATGKTLTLSKAAVEAAFPEGSIIKQEVKLYPFTFDLALLEAQGYTVTDNGDGSVTVDGGTEGSSGYIEFFNGSLPEGTYEVSYLEEGTGIAWGLTVTHNDFAGPVNGGDAIQINVANGDVVTLSIDLMGAYSSRKMTVTLKKLVTWDSLVATKPNWTISLV